MDTSPSDSLLYKRARFVTTLPLGYLYHAGHFWVARSCPGTWRVGLTKFGSRLLGEIVDFGFDAVPGSIVGQGEFIGWIEGFKAVSELFCLGKGRFVGSNPELEKSVTLVNKDPCDTGWLYSFSGEPDPDCLDAHAYAKILDQTIDKLLEQT
jgi:glycine cleavage system H protein